ncbi:MAG: nuclear transport factor 2 family protein [Dysgonomonas sp.]|nr:nuclear transport factor 2 family protein [Dysgonomonas sp.]
MIKNEIITCEAKLLKAMKECDIKTLDELLHDELIFNGPTGELVTKEIDLNAYQSGNMVIEENKISDQEIRTFGDTALVAVTVGIKGQFMKQPIAGKFRYIRTWKMIDKQWKMIGGGCTPIPI